MQMLENCSNIFTTPLIPALTSVPLLDFFDDLKWNWIWSSVVTCDCPDDPQSDDGPETRAQATYQRPAWSGTGSSKRMGYFCLTPHSYVNSSDSASSSPSLS